LTLPNLYELWRLRLFSFGGYGLALAALALVVFGAIECPPKQAGIAYGSLVIFEDTSINNKWKASDETFALI